ncbi:hypothetical protein A0H81_03351 [Grifola frondosa]|uniref:Uncharacterized protein n=1 Tax=Grifola frondosa TaxID=5627 RepID=A0A1C7MGU3_GRIFR|nr:hypothetical protein A0H81_03351 [Grifola frondosa]
MQRMTSAWSADRGLGVPYRWHSLPVDTLTSAYSGSALRITWFHIDIDTPTRTVEKLTRTHKAAEPTFSVNLPYGLVVYAWYMELVLLEPYACDRANPSATRFKYGGCGDDLHVRTSSWFKLKSRELPTKLLLSSPFILMFLKMLSQSYLSITQSSQMRKRLYTLRNISSNSKFSAPIGHGEQVTALLAQLDIRTIQADQRGFEATLQGLRTATLTARLDDASIVKRNYRQFEINPGSSQYIALRKVVAGDGLALAESLRNTQVVPALPADPVVGEVLDEVIDIVKITAVDILRLIRFYNQDFGIKADEDRAPRAQKIFNSLIGFSSI